VIRRDECASCPLAACPVGARAVVLCIGCSPRDAQRLRTLGLFEGTPVSVVGSHTGILLDVRGSRLALGVAVATAITVRALLP
jgi:Fe2+ transport system protein FeoA